MNKWKVTYYQNTRELFSQLGQQLNNNEITARFKENKDTCTLGLEIKYKDKTLQFFYLYGHTQGVGVSDDDYFKTPTDPQSLQIKILNQVEDYLKKWKKEESDASN